MADFYQRALPGSLFYALGCLVTAWFGDYFSRYPALVLGWVAAFVVLGYLRRVHRPPADLGDVAASQRWWLRHWTLVHMGCALWCGFLTVVGAIEHAPSLVLLIVVLCTVAYSSAGCETFSFSRRHALLVISLLQLPALAVFWLAVPPLHGVAVVLLVYFVYQVTHIRRRGKEYTDQIGTEHALITSHAEIERMARLDVLTGLANRRAYQTAYDLHWHHAARKRSALALLVIDLDHFKQINDSLGHQAGDACLQHVAQLLEQRFRRANETVARIGGEEFAVVLPDTQDAEAQRLAEAFCAELAQSTVLFEEHRIQLTASAGVGTVRWDQDSSPQASFSRVDAACYRAKAQGRNRVAPA
jgi:diguanylate cyclase (GGDEF)-like protein